MVCTQFSIFFIDFVFIVSADVGSFHYGEDHPMKPFRIKMAHQLIIGYELYRKMNVYVSLDTIIPNSQYLRTFSISIATK